MITIAGTLLAGLGLFFGGLQLLTANLKRLSSRRLRMLVARYSRTPLMGLLWGGVFIAITQSGAATMFVIVSMMRSGMVSVRQALPMIVGVNAIGAMIIMVLVIDIELAVLFLLGFAGTLYKTDSRNTPGSIVGAMFGAAILFYGLHLMKSGVAPLAGEPWFADVLEWTRGSYMLGFLAGCALSFAVQSTLAVVAVILAFQLSGVFGFGEAVMIVYGANTGSSILTLVLSLRLTGQAKQIAMFQSAYNILGALLLVPLFYIEIWTGAPLMMALVAAIADDPGGRVAVTLILFNLVPAGLLLPLLTHSVRLLERLWPDTEVEVAARPRYLHEHAAEDPYTAMDLVALEQRRLVGYLSQMFAALRTDRPDEAFARIREAFGILAATVNEAIDDIASGQRLTGASYDRLNALLSFQRALESAGATLSEIARDHRALAASDTGRRFLAAIVEGVDTIVLTLSEVLREGDDTDRALLEAVTSEDGNGVRTVRATYLAAEPDLDAEDRMRLLAVANHAERLIWLLGEMGRSAARAGAD